MHCENLNVPQRAAQNNCGRRDKLNSTRLKYYVNQLYNLSNFQTRNIDRKWLPNKNIRRSHISARLIIDGGRSSKIKLKKSTRQETTYRKILHPNKNSLFS